MKRIKISYLVSIVFVVLIGFQGCQNKAKILCESQSLNESVQYISSHWGLLFRDIADITDCSDKIAVVKVKKLISCTEDLIPESYFEVEVLQAIYDCEDKDVFTVAVQGGTYQGQVIEMENDPILQVGDELLLYTMKDRDGYYYILGGPQGRLAYRDGKVTSLHNDEEYRLRQSDQINGEDGLCKIGNIDLFEEPIENIISAVEKVKS